MVILSSIILLACTVFGSSAVCRNEAEVALGTSSIMSYYIVYDDVISVASMRFLQKGCNTPVAIDITPLNYMKSSVPVHLKSGKSEYFSYGFTSFFPLSDSYIDSVAWNCLFPLQVKNPLTVRNNKCTYRNGGTYDVFDTFIANKEGTEMKAPFEYEIPSNLTYFSYVTTSGSDFSINTLYPSEKEDNFTQFICSEMETIRLPPSCEDGLQNGYESDKDCGGISCTGCENGKICYASTDCLSNSCVNFKCTNGYTNVIIIFGILAAVVVFLIPFIFSILYFSKTRSQRIVRYKLSYKKTKVPTIPVVEVPQTSVGAHYKLNV